MIESVHLRNYGKITDLQANSLGKINLIVGTNGCGKTFLLKSLYTAIKSVEELGRGDDVRNIVDILSERLRWCFQTKKLGDLVKKGTKEHLAFDMSCGAGKIISYTFSNSTEVKVNHVVCTHPPRNENSIFLPAKEVLSLYNIINEYSRIQKRFGFDSTYSDLIEALSIAPHRGKNYKVFSLARESLFKLLGGKADFDSKKNEWYYKEGNMKFPIGSASEGVKKLSILDRLLANGYLSRDSVIFIDELESALHPRAISEFIKLIAEMAEQMNIQFFISTHSYHVVKSLHLVAVKKNIPTPFISFEKDEENNAVYKVADLRDEVPDNPIIQESIRIFEEEMELAFQ